MEVKIGVTDVTRELTIDTDLDADQVEEKVREAISGEGVFSLADSRGRRVVVPVDRLGYVEVTTSTAGQVGFRS